MITRASNPKQLTGRRNKSVPQVGNQSNRKVDSRLKPASGQGSTARPDKVLPRRVVKPRK